MYLQSGRNPLSLLVQVAQIRRDVHDIGTVVLKMMRGRNCRFKPMVKLEAFGKNGH